MHSLQQRLTPCNQCIICNIAIDSIESVDRRVLLSFDYGPLLLSLGGMSKNQLRLPLRHLSDVNPDYLLVYP